MPIFHKLPTNNKDLNGKKMKEIQFHSLQKQGNRNNICLEVISIQSTQNRHIHQDIHKSSQLSGFTTNHSVI